MYVCECACSCRDAQAWEHVHKYADQVNLITAVRKLFTVGKRSNTVPGLLGRTVFGYLVERVPSNTSEHVIRQAVNDLLSNVLSHPDGGFELKEHPYDFLHPRLARHQVRSIPRRTPSLRQLNCCT